jgi:hypothetical protein
MISGQGSDLTSDSPPSSGGIIDNHDLEDIDRNAVDHPRRQEGIIDYQHRSESNLSLLKRLQLRLFGYAYVDHRRRPGWRGSLPFYAFKCDVHGLVEDYPHGYKKRLDCPLCLREDELISIFSEEKDELEKYSDSQMM